MSRQRQQKFAVIGLGDFGQSLALALNEGECHVVGIDRDALLVHRLQGKMRAVQLDATDEAALREQQLEGYTAAVVAMPGDFEGNVMVTAALKSVGAPQVISVCSAAYERETLLSIGADRVLEPQTEGGRRLAEELMQPSVKELVPLGSRHYLVALRTPPALGGQPLSALTFEQDLKQVVVLAIQRGCETLTAPSPSTELLAGDTVIILGSDAVLSEGAHVLHKLLAVAAPEDFPA